MTPAGTLQKRRSKTGSSGWESRLACHRATKKAAKIAATINNPYQ